ncbi:hypothetical protein GCK72_004592 [Caenorhabditis remanei]|uniref:F-box domain-containing protein n=1 Tax=Caenorhabditis remanei TaxID=31234 RepID=A0A6A5HE29_CAERE|nr:hypothetical protein GCK72_004592 [Caenorhabditis remanei]KAF1764643.1 hypothetical protein GCK72_004592 [Caenorhabditis remanei]
MSAAFPLLRLPKKALHQMLYSIDYVDIVSFSLASNKTKEVVKSLNLKTNNINLGLENIIRIQIDAFKNNTTRLMWNFYRPLSLNPIVYMPARVIGMREPNPTQNHVKYRNPGLSIREWHYKSHERTIVVKGGYDIRRTDGTVGTVTIRQRFQERFVLFHVWC